MHAHPLFTISTITFKVVVYAERVCTMYNVQCTLPLFLLYSYMYSERKWRHTMCTNTLPHPNNIYYLFSSVFHGIHRGPFLIFCPTGLVRRGEFKLYPTRRRPLKISRQLAQFLKYENKIASSARGKSSAFLTSRKSSQWSFGQKSHSNG